MKLSFKPPVESQRELIHQWFEQEYIRKWIHGVGLQNTLNGLEKVFQFHAAGKTYDRIMDITQHWIGYEDEHPFVYLLTSNIDKNAEDDYAQYCDEEGFAITLDMFIIDPNYVGQGLAAQVIQTFLDQHFADVSEVLIDPEKENARAVHVYQKAGFQIIGEFIAPWHPVPHHIMKLKRNEK